MQVDGLITHGLDTLPYTSNMLSFLIQGLNKPVVLTGSIVVGKTNTQPLLNRHFDIFKVSTPKPISSMQPKLPHLALVK